MADNDRGAHPRMAPLTCGEWEVFDAAIQTLERRERMFVAELDRIKVAREVLTIVEVAIQ